MYEATKELGDVWTLMHDYLSIQRSEYRKEWLYFNNFHVMSWMLKSPPLNVIYEDCVMHFTEV